MVIPVIMMIIPATVTATMMTMPILDNWYRNEDWIVVPISFHFDDLCRRLVDDDLRFLWRFFGFVFFRDRGWRKHGGSNFPDHGFRPVGREAPRVLRVSQRLGHLRGVRRFVEARFLETRAKRLRRFSPPSIGCCAKACSTANCPTKCG